MGEWNEEKNGEGGCFLLSPLVIFANWSFD